jgi:pimeloyl-ACP methyl ester carboxylesterase
MKKNLTILTLLLNFLCFAQDITGAWNGSLNLPQGELPLIINISKSGSSYSATMDSPKQGAKDIPVAIAFEDNNLHITLPAANFDYKATYVNNVFNGTLNQNGNTYKLDLKRGETAKLKRPQEPVAPYPYHTEEVTFKNDKAGITLAGTLTLPKKEGVFPAVILITGSGGQNRDEELFGHKPFLVLADYLTRKGVAVLRYDDRGVGQSGGVFETATTADFATDAQAALNYLQTRREINKKKTGLAGHSEGGAVAAMVAAGNADVAFVVLMAGSNIPGDELMVLQNYMLGKAGGMPEEDLTLLGGINRKLYDVIKLETNPEKMKKGLEVVFNTDLKPLFLSKGIPEAQFNQAMKIQLEGLLTPWYVSFIKSRPALYLEKIKCPVLALNGDKDLQVAAVANLEAVKRAAEKSGNKNVTVKQMKGLNHLFQEAATGLPAEYETIEQTLSPSVMEEISGWISTQTK